MTQALSILESVFGFPSFLGKQGEIIEHVANGGDALVLMPTGGGKSLCFQIPALMREGCGIVVSPLIALMHDQVAALREAGVRAACLNSSLSTEAAANVERELLAGGLDLLYVAPERLTTPRFLGLLERSRLALFAIDEAHCVSQWGHDFRPEYVELTLLADRHPAVPRIALTATADEATRREIVSRLKLDDARVFISSFDRPNIRYEVVEKENARAQLLDFIRARHPGESGIVYCLSRTKTEETAAWRAVRRIAYLGEASRPCGNCDNCLNPPRVWDGTVAAQQALSCVYRTGQRFGAGHVTDVLLGRTTERVSQLGHDRLSTFGIGKDRDERQWRAVFRQLVALGHLWADGEAFGALKLTQSARQVLKGETSVMLREQAARPARVKRGKKTARETSGAAAPDSALLRALRAWRLGIAREHGVPAFVVFHDATLETIATLRPGTREALRGVSGVGEKKLERYGEALLEVVRSHSV